MWFFLYGGDRGLVAKLSESCDPIDCSPPGSSVHGISRQEYWSGLPFPFPGDLLNPRIEPVSLMSPALSGEFFITHGTWEVQPKWEGNPKMRVCMYTYC